jgi:hypothetical protein
VKRTELRYPGATPTSSSDSKLGIRNSEPTRGLYSWDTSEGSLVIELRGQRVVILEGIPAGVDAKALAGALWQ